MAIPPQGGTFAAGGGRDAVDAGRDRGVAPPCSCHGQPMLARHDRPGKWRCKVKQQEYDHRYQRARYRRMVAEGICGNCKKQPAAVGVRCFDCAVDAQFRESIRPR